MTPPKAAAMTPRRYRHLAGLAFNQASMAAERSLVSDSALLSFPLHF
jgi:hypothetical protein